MHHRGPTLSHKTNQRGESSSDGTRGNQYKGNTSLTRKTNSTRYLDIIASHNSRKLASDKQKMFLQVTGVQELLGEYSCVIKSVYHPETPLVSATSLLWSPPTFYHGNATQFATEANWLNCSYYGYPREHKVEALRGEQYKKMAPASPRDSR